MPSTFQSQLAGLCGTSGGNAGPLNLPLYIRSWPKVLATIPCPLPQTDFIISCPTQLAQIFKAPKLCELLRAPECPSGYYMGHISPMPFLRLCLKGIYHTCGQHCGLYDVLTACTAACQEPGIPVMPWMGPKLCHECSSWVRDASKASSASSPDGNQRSPDMDGSA